MRLKNDETLHSFTFLLNTLGASREHLTKNNEMAHTFTFSLKRRGKT